MSPSLSPVNGHLVPNENIDSPPTSVRGHYGPAWDRLPPMPTCATLPESPLPPPPCPPCPCSSEVNCTPRLYMLPCMIHPLPWCHKSPPVQSISWVMAFITKPLCFERQCSEYPRQSGREENTRTRVKHTLIQGVRGALGGGRSQGPMSWNVTLFGKYMHTEENGGHVVRVPPHLIGSHCEENAAFFTVASIGLSTASHRFQLAGESSLLQSSIMHVVR
jgi:hypothetical protein